MLARYKTWVRRNRALLSALEQGAAGLTWLVPEGGNSDVYMVRPTPRHHRHLPRVRCHTLAPSQIVTGYSCDHHTNPVVPRGRRVASRRVAAVG